MISANSSNNSIHVFLTGATGLVGRYVLADLLRRNISTTVLVRNTRRLSATERINASLEPFETHALLPRPSILVGDLKNSQEWSHAFQGLPKANWHVIHCAASIQFDLDTNTNEPYSSNVDGTSDLLKVCRDLDVRCFHHVSTAYVYRPPVNHVGTAIALESLATSDVPSGNDYEKSKIAAERLVSTCPWISKYSIYRPSIIVGDSLTGFTSTFHGFYTPLRVGAQLAKSQGVNPSASVAFREAMGLHRDDQKNLVPVDWVASAIVELVLRPESYGNIFHLTNPNPIDSADIQDVITQTLQRYFPNTSRHHQVSPSDAAYFLDQVRTYRSYFQSDPAFDQTNLLRYLPDLRCPKLGTDELSRMASYALDSNFGLRGASAPKSAGQGKILPTSTGELLPAPFSNTANNRGCMRVDLLGRSESICNSSGASYYRKQASGWCQSSLPLDSSEVDFRITVNAPALDQCIRECEDPVQLAFAGLLVAHQPRPDNWQETLREWVQSLRSGLE